MGEGSEIGMKNEKLQRTAYDKRYQCRIYKRSNQLKNVKTVAD